ncbi:MAG: ABC-F family ATP-binding cassette domain-containing protein [Firmicutes bacterium]|nr:ABC-F family ATP-binding cassette domain-containing protein [Bacillota bacterium]
MSILQVHNLKKLFGADLILNNVSFQLQAGERVGLIGANGAGKTTLLNIIAGRTTADDGTIFFARDSSLGYLEQSSAVTLKGSMQEELYRAFAHLDKMAKHLRLLEKEMAEQKLTAQQLENIMSTYGELRHRYEEAGGYVIDARVRSIVCGLGFQLQDLERPINTFSGGEQTRIRLAKLLLEEPSILLLDEPTNHLDIKAVEWLEKYLCDWPGTILVVSHDRYFLDRIVQRILLLENGQLKSYNGNYESYLAQRQVEQKTQLKAYQKQQDYLQKEMNFIRSLGSSEREKRQVKSRLKRLDKLSPVVKPEKAKRMVLDFSFSGRSGEIAVRLEDVTKTFAGKTVFSNVSFELRWGDRVALVGPNGSGKSSLLKLITKELQPDSGRVWLGPSVKPVYFDQHQQTITPTLTPLEEIMAASDLNIAEARNHLAKFLFTGEAVYKRNADLSGGEKSRLMLAKLSLDAGNFLVLDEPTNHLDITAVEELEESIRAFPGTLLIVSHDRYFLNRTTDKVLQLDNGVVTFYQVPYKEYTRQRDMKIKAEKTPFEKQQRLEEKRRRQDEQQKRRLRRQLTERVQNLEAAIIQQEKRLSEVEKELLSPEVFNDYQLAAAKGEEMKKLKDALQRLYAQWEEDMEQLEAMLEEK